MAGDVWCGVLLVRSRPLPEAEIFAFWQLMMMGHQGDHDDDDDDGCLKALTTTTIIASRNIVRKLVDLELLCGMSNIDRKEYRLQEGSSNFVVLGG